MAEEVTKQEDTSDDAFETKTAEPSSTSNGAVLSPTLTSNTSTSNENNNNNNNNNNNSSSSSSSNSNNPNLKSAKELALRYDSLGPTSTLYQVENYSVQQKEPKYEKDTSVGARLTRYAEMYKKEGMRRVVEGIILVHRHGHPHILLLQIGTYFKLPGGKLKPGESEIEGLKRKLNSKLGPSSGDQMDWDIGDLVATWWRPNFDPNLYPYLPPHVTKAKECRKQFLVILPENCEFWVPRNFKLKAVPLFMLYGNTQDYGPMISAVPILLARFKFNCA